MPEQPKSRLDRELDEILTKKSREPIPFSSQPRAPKRKGTEVYETSVNRARSWWKQLTSIPLLLAYILVIIARLVSDLSPLIALLLCTAAVVTIWLPGILRLVRPATPDKPDVKYWRGRAYTSEIKDVASRHPVDSLKRYFDRRR